MRELRVEAARRVPPWTELQVTDLAPRSRVLVHAVNDTVYRIHRGANFAPGQARPFFGDQAPLAFYVGHEDGELVFLEDAPGFPTWTAYLEERAELERRRSAPETSAVLDGRAVSTGHRSCSRSWLRPGLAVLLLTNR